MPKRRKKFLQIDRNRHGTAVYYFRRDNRRVRLPDSYGSQEFWAAYETLLAGGSYERPAVFSEPRSPTQLAISVAIRAGIRRAKKRAAANGWSFDLTEDWLLAEITRRQHRCALSRIPFFTTCAIKSQVHPFAPSIDRIDSRRGYTRDNVRVVVFAMNMMLADWGEDVFHKVANGYRSFRSIRQASAADDLAAQKDFPRVSRTLETRHVG